MCGSSQTRIFARRKNVIDSNEHKGNSVREGREMDVKSFTSIAGSATKHFGYCAEGIMANHTLQIEAKFV